MFKKFYGFQDMPFSPTGDCDPKLVYQSQNYEMVLPILVSSLDKKVTLTLVLGEIGVGKTTLINYLCDQFQQNFSAGLIDADFDSTQEFFQKILASFDLKICSTDIYEMLLQLSFFFNAKYKDQGEQSTLLIIDDADSMTYETLKGIEFLLGLNTDETQVIQLVLIGKPKLEDMINKSGLEGLLKYSRSKCLLDPLTAEETQHYIQYNINQAGVQNEKLIDEKACSLIYEYSEGIPAIINWICNKALVRGNELKKHEISTELVREVVENQVEVSKKKGFTWGALTSGFVFAGLVLALLFLPNYFISSPEEPQTVRLSDLERYTIKNKPNVEKQNLAKIHQNEGSSANLVKKEVLAENNKHNTKLTKTDKDTKLPFSERHLANINSNSAKNKNAHEANTALSKSAPKNITGSLQRIADHYLNQAKKQRINGNIGKSQLSISRGLKIYPNHKQLSKLKSEISAEIKQAEKQNKINALLTQAEQQIENLQLTNPIDNNAYKTYQEIVALDKRNREAIRGIQKILAQLKSQTLKAIDEEYFPEALEVSNEIQQLAAKGKKDPFHEEAVFAAFETKSIVDDQLKRLLNLANIQRATQRLTQPAGDNALESYNKALQIDPDNAEAKKGLESLNMQYQKLVEAALSEGKTSKALVTADEALMAFPKNRKLISLRSDAVLEHEMLQKRAEDSVTRNKSEDKIQKLKSFGTF